MKPSTRDNPQRTTHGTEIQVQRKGLPESMAQMGTGWLQGIVQDLCRRAAEILPPLQIMRKTSLT